MTMYSTITVVVLLIASYSRASELKPDPLDVLTEIGDPEDILAVAGIAGLKCDTKSTANSDDKVSIRETGANSPIPN